MSDEHEEALGCLAAIAGTVLLAIIIWVALWILHFLWIYRPTFDGQL